MDRIYVTVRARPLSPEESKSSPWKISGNSIILSNNQSTKFEFDRIFGEDCRTADVFEARTKEIVASAVRGFNGTVFAYGQTNSGKTYTMRGSIAEPGIIPLAVHDLFSSIQEDATREFLVRMSYMEIYNEEINDLLAPEHRKLQIHENIERGIYVAGLREEIVTCPKQVLDFMEFGESHRHIGQTNMNVYSSRSHTIFRMIIESRVKPEDGDEANSCDAVRVSVLNLVDLAGSERAAKTGAEGMRLKEGSHINKSLMTLGTVIKKLSEGTESQGGHVPYRDSKLTRILQPALGGNANTAIICNITLAQVHSDETKSTLQFASRALRVTNCACVNEILTDAALLKRQRKEIEELRAKLLSSHSEHSEEEILNLRNTLLQSELEKERIALELEEEKKERAQRERRLAEQAKKIANLSSLVLCSDRDDKSLNIIKNKRRVTWCPGPLLKKVDNEIHTSNVETTTRESSGDTDVGIPPFEELMQENDILMDDLDNKSSRPCSKDGDDEFCLPDAHSLLHVTSRRKVHGRAGSHMEINELLEDNSKREHSIFQCDAQMKASDTESRILTCMFEETECSGSGTRTSSFISQLNDCASCCRGSLTVRESEAIHVIKQLEDQIRSVEIEKAAMQRNLDNVLELISEQNVSFSKKYNALNQERLSACNEARMAQEQLSSVALNTLFGTEGKVFSSIGLSKEIQEVALQIDHSRSVVDNILSFVGNVFQNFSFISEVLLDVKSFAKDDMVQFESIVCGHNKIQGYMRKKMDELELEKNTLQNILVDHQKKTQELEANFVDWEKTMTDKCIQHELEKDELLGQVLSLQRELSGLSNSTLVREKDNLRKELEKTKLKLKDTEAKLKNISQDKTKVESEKMQAEREIKRLVSQRAILERDIWKRDSFTDRRHSKSFESCNPKGSIGIQEQNLLMDYQKLEVRIFEMEAEITDLKEALATTTEEKEEACTENGVLELKLVSLTNKLNDADLEINFLKEEIIKLEQKLGESESLSISMKTSLDLLKREKEEMGMQLADALLEMEVEKSTWVSKEKAFNESNQMVKLSNNQIASLSKDLLEVRHELETLREQNIVHKERLTSSEVNAEREKECSHAIRSENEQLRNELEHFKVDKGKYEGVCSKLEFQMLEYHRTCEELKKVQGQLHSIIQDRDELLLQVKKEKGLATLNYNQESLIANKEKTKLRMQLRSTQAKLDALRVRYKELLDEKTLMNKKFEEASSNYKEKLRWYGSQLLESQKQLFNKT